MPVDNGSSQAILLDVINSRSTKVFKTLNDACSEWKPNFDHWGVDNAGRNPCKCNHWIKYEFSIRNILNGEVITPIGSCCIRRFDNETMNSALKYTKRLCLLRDKILSGEKIMFSEEFNRSIYNWLLLHDVISSNELSIIKNSKKAMSNGYDLTPRQFYACQGIFQRKIMPAILNFERVMQIGGEYDVD